MTIDPTVPKVCKLHVDLPLTPDVIDHPRCYIDIHGVNEVGVGPLGMVLRIDTSVESRPATHEQLIFCDD